MDSIERRVSIQQSGPKPNSITVVSNIYHRTDFEVKDFTVRWEKPCKSQDDAYQRRVTVTQEWVEVDTGWVGESVGMLCIKNMHGGDYDPVKGMAPNDFNVVQVSFTEDSEQAMLVYPNDALICRPTGKLFMRSRAGNIPVMILAIPE